MVLNPGDLVSVDFPGVTGVKRHPTVILSSSTYHSIRPDIIVGLITSQAKGLGATDYILQDWAVAGLRVEFIFSEFYHYVAEIRKYHSNWSFVRARLAGCLYLY
jgi:mRNA interferase MazF